MTRQKKIRDKTHAKHGEYSDALAYAVASRDQATMSMVKVAIRHKQVLLAYQPVVSARNTSIPSFYEGLIRVLDDTDRIIPASDFMATVENTELGRQLDCLALELGLKVLREQTSLRLSINMSARSIGYGPWADLLKRQVGGTSTLGERLILEISEASVNQVPDLIRNFMTEMRPENVSFALDDYGAGMTSLQVFKEFDFDFVKLDGSFSRKICSDPDNQVLASAVAAIAEKFDMMSIASRVETPQDARALASLGFDGLQGYAFGAPTIKPPWTTDQKRAAYS